MGWFEDLQKRAAELRAGIRGGVGLPDDRPQPAPQPTPVIPTPVTDAGAPPKPIKPTPDDKPTKPPREERERRVFVKGATARIGGCYATPPSGGCTDCSGLVADEFRDATGRSVSPDSHSQYADLPAITTSRNLKPGDLVFWNTGFSHRRGNDASHVGIFVGDGKIVNALNKSRGIIASSIDADYGGPLLGYRRLPWSVGPDPEPDPLQIGDLVRVTATEHVDFRAVPPISAARMREILEAAHSPMAAEANAIHAASKGRPLPLAQTWMESRYGVDPSAQATHNPLGLLWYPGMTPVMPVDDSNSHGVPLIVFPNWAAAFIEWSRRMDDPNYKGGVYPQGAGIGQYIRIYVAGPGPGYANGESAESVAHYLNETLNRLNRYYGTAAVPVTPAPGPTGGSTALGTEYKIPGLAKTIYLPFPLEVRILPLRQSNQRPGIGMVPDRYIQHETGNYRPGTGAENHYTYLVNGAEGQQLSYHATVDDVKAVWMIPANEVTWHGGDGAGVCNYRGISCELCVNHPAGSPEDRRARNNAAVLAAEVIMAGDLKLEPHRACCQRLANPTGCHLGCPERILSMPGGFETFANAVAIAQEARAR